MKIKITAATNSQLISVFWYVDGKVIGIDETLSGPATVQYGNMLQVDVDHFNVWDNVKSAYHLKDVEYDYYPRGRVMFDVRLHKFVIIADEKIVNSDEAIANILQYCGIQRNQVSAIDYDEHYSSEVGV